MKVIGIHQRLKDFAPANLLEGTFLLQELHILLQINN